MLQNGYIKLHREIMRWEFWNDPPVFRTFLVLLLEANVTDSMVHGVQIERGQVLTSYPRLAKDTGLSVMQIRLALKKLSTTGSITVKKMPKFSVVSINNYKKFQDTTVNLTVSERNSQDNSQNNSQDNSQNNSQKNDGNQRNYKGKQKRSKKYNSQHNSLDSSQNNSKHNTIIRRNKRKGVSKDTPPKEEKEKIPLPWANSAWRPVIPEGWTEEEYAEYIRKLSR